MLEREEKLFPDAFQRKCKRLIQRTNAGRGSRLRTPMLPSLGGLNRARSGWTSKCGRATS